MRKLSETRRRKYRLRRRLPFLAFAAFVFLCLPVPFAQEASPVAESPAGVPLLQPEQVGLVTCSVNGVPVGDIEVGIYRDEPLLSLATLSEVLTGFLRSDVYDNIFNVILSKREWISRDDLNRAGIQSDWDMTHVQLSLKVPPSYSPVTDIDIAPQYTANIKPVLKPSPVSGHLDFSASMDLNIEDATVSVPLELTTRSVLNVYGWVAEAVGSVTASEETLSSSLTTARVVHDFPDINGRLFLGRVSTPGLSYQSQPELYGLTLKSEEIVKQKAKPGFYELFSEFTVETQSTVRIKLNGLTFRTVSLSPGNYRLLDLPFTYGLNNFVLEIEDAEGVITQQKAVIPREMNLLAEGFSEYSVSAGVGRNEIAEPFGSAYYRRGLSPRFTAGLMGQADYRSALAGTSFIFASKIGNFTGSVAAVAAWDERDYPFTGAGSLQYRFVLPGNDFIPSFGLSAEYYSEGFSSPIPLSTFTEMEQTLRLGGQIGGKLTKYMSYSFSGYWTKTYSTVDSETVNASASINQSLGAGTSLSLISNYSVTRGSDPNFSITLMLFVLPKEKAGRSVSFIQSGDGTNSLSYVDKLDQLGGLDFNLHGSNLMIGSAVGSTIGLSGRKTSRWGDLGLSADFNYADPANPDSGDIQLTAASTLAFAGGRFAITRQIDDSFVLFAPSKEMAAEKVYLRVESSGTVISQNGNTAILPVTSYRPTPAYMDLPEAPPDVLPRIQAALISPTYKSGTLYASDILRRYRVTGKLAGANGAAVGYVAGDLVDQAGTNLTSTFTDENGDFEIYDLVPGSYTIVWPDYIGTTAFELAETADGYYSLGPVVPNEANETTK